MPEGITAAVPERVKAAAKRCSIADAPSVGTVKRVVQFGIVACDASGVRLTDGGEPFLVHVRGPARTRARVTDGVDGRYAVEWVPSTSGVYQVAVTLRGKLLQGTPFVVTVLDPQPFAPNCEVVGDALTMAHVRSPQSFEVTFRDQLGQLAPAVELQVFVEPLDMPNLSPRSPLRSRRSPSPTEREHSPQSERPGRRSQPQLVPGEDPLITKLKSEVASQWSTVRHHLQKWDMDKNGVVDRREWCVRCRPRCSGSQR